jgi:hypothetical protein
MAACFGELAWDNGEAHVESKQDWNELKNRDQLKKVPDHRLLLLLFCRNLISH